MRAFLRKLCLAGARLGGKLGVGTRTFLRKLFLAVARLGGKVGVGMRTFVKKLFLAGARRGGKLGGRMRTFPKQVLLGRSRLELRSRLWMALLLLLVIGASYYWVDQWTRRLLMEQIHERAALVAKAVQAERDADVRALQKFSGQPEQFPHLLEQRVPGMAGVRWRQIYQGAEKKSSQPEDEYEQKILSWWQENWDKRVARRSTERDAKEDPVVGRSYQLLVPLSAGPREAGRSCRACHPGFPPDSFQGLLSVELPLKETRSALRNIDSLLAASAVVTLLVALGTLYLLVSYLLAPLHRLKQTTDAVAAGDLTARAAVKTGDELEDFASALNHMIDSVEQSHQAQVELNRNLDAQLNALGRANLELHEMNQLRTEFLANMSHELRSPLHSILGFAQVLLEETYGPLTGRQRRYIQNMVSSGRDLLDLIENLLDLSRLEAGRMQRNLDRTSLGELVGSVVAKLEPLRSSGLTVQVQVDEGLPTVLLDLRKTSRILSNLLSNAYKFTPDGGQVTVSATVRAGMAVLTVADTGIGIPEAELPRIFDKFRQANRGVVREHEGTGLGLSIVRELVRFLGGEVTVASEPGKGSTFTVTLPLGDATGPEAAREGEQSSRPSAPEGQAKRGEVSLEGS
jgi:signal transduction histidine kinase